MTGKRVISLNTYKEREVKESFDGYVTLAFFLTAILTVILVLLIARYIMIQTKREDERLSKPNKVFPLPKRDIDELSYDSEFNYSEYDENECEFINAEETTVSSEKEEIELLETNYLKNEEYVEIDVEKKPKSLHFDKMIELLGDVTMDKKNIFNKIFFQREYYKSMISWSCPLQCMTSFYLEGLCTFRKNTIEEMLIFILRRLYEAHVLVESDYMQMVSKYVQLLEIQSNDPIKGMLLTSEGFNKITETFLKDVDAICEENPNKMEDILYNLCLPNLESLKMLPTMISKIPDLTAYIFLSVKENVFKSEKVTMLVSYRLVSFEEVVLKLVSESNSTKILPVLETHKSNIIDYIQGVASLFQNQLDDNINSLTNDHFRDISAFKNSQSAERNKLTIEISTLEVNSYDDHLKILLEHLVALHSYENEKLEDALMKICDKELLNMTKLFQNISKLLMRKISESEEEVYLALQENGFSDDDILEVADRFQNDLRDVNELFINKTSTLLSKFEEVFIVNCHIISKLIEELVKQASSAYQTSIATFEMTISCVPCLNNNDSSTLTKRFKQWLMVVAFDVVVIEINKLIHSLEESYNEGFERENIIMKIVRNITSKKKFEPLVCLDVETRRLEKLENMMNNFSINQRKEEHYRIIKTLFEEQTEQFILNKIHEESTNITKSLLKNHGDIYTGVKNILNNLPPENISKKKSLKSRKGKSHVETTKEEKLEGIYNSHLGMKETRMEEYLNTMEKHKIKNSLKSKQKSNMSLCIEMIRNRDFREDPSEERSKLEFKLDKQYMIDRFVKKLIEFKEEI